MSRIQLNSRRGTVVRRFQPLIVYLTIYAKYDDINDKVSK